MGKNINPTIESEIDQFVEHLNNMAKEHEDLEELPEPFRVGPPDEYGCFAWRVLKSDCSRWINPLLARLPKRFPESYLSLVSRYAFPSFEVGEMFFWGNTGLDYYWELRDCMFRDEYMSSILMKNGFLQIGNPAGGSYDPICFDAKKANKKDLECPIAWLDHEELLCNDRIVAIKEIAGSFIEYIRALSKADS